MSGTIGCDTWGPAFFWNKPFFFVGVGINTCCVGSVLGFPESGIVIFEGEGAAVVFFELAFILRDNSFSDPEPEQFSAFIFAYMSPHDTPLAGRVLIFSMCITVSTFLRYAILIFIIKK